MFLEKFPFSFLLDLSYRKEIPYGVKRGTGGTSRYWESFIDVFLIE